jgi:hypothetical protein
MRISILVLLLCGGAAIAEGPEKAEGSEKFKHPHFADGGVIRWYTKLADAQAVAKKEGKLILIEYGREQ